MEHNGLAAQIITKAFAVSGFEVLFDFFPWKRAVAYVENGKYDASPLWLKSEI
ncbi:MAG: hypothetical protein HOD92_01450 [Deltaproteobacteria bacterium]|nr:hypothetical protein [Deltaproteobacteria bacterium]MBT4525257.1 hypothetical protein [Deltaproteobacteria bacterium]